MKRPPLGPWRALVATPADTALTAVLAIGLGWAGWGILGWAFGRAQWLVVRANAATLMVGRYPEPQQWRLWLLLGMLVSLAGLGWGLLRGPGRWPRNDRLAAVGLAAATLVLPPLLALGAVNQLRLLLLLALLLLLRWAVARGSSHPGLRRIGQAWGAVWAVAYLLGLWLIAGGLGLPTVRPADWGGWMFTLLITSLTLALALPLGVLLALGRRSELPLLRWLSVAYIELIRGAPLITLLFLGQNLVGFLVPGGLAPDRVWRAAAVLTGFAAAYLAEAVRGGLTAVPRGQMEAARSLGLSVPLAIRHVVLPQALRVALPAMVGQCIALLQDTTLLSIIGLFDLLGTARSVLANPDWLGRYAEVYLVLAVLYWCSCAALSMGSRALEQRLSLSRDRAPAPSPSPSAA
ncbi:MAG: amino acid ABC transporter permease [Synechococcus sp.]